MLTIQKKKMISIFGAFLIIVGVLIILIARQGFILRNFKSHGISAQATIQKKYKKTESKLQYSQHGRSKYSFRTTSNYLLDITFSSNKESNGGKFIASMAKADDKMLNSIKKGDEVSIFYLPENPTNTAVLKESLFSLNFGKPEIDNYLKNGDTVTAIVDEINKKEQSVRVIFFSNLSLKIGDLYSSTIGVDKSIWDDVATGHKIEIRYLAENPEQNVFSAIMVERGSVNPYFMIILASLIFVAGILLITVFGKSTKIKNHDVYEEYKFR